MKFNPNTPKDFLKGHIDSATKLGYDSTHKSANKDTGGVRRARVYAGMNRKCIAVRTAC